MDQQATFEFDQATAISLRSEADRFDIDLSPGWTVGPKPNGGYLLAVAGRAAGEALGGAGSDHRDAVAATVHFLAAPDAGPAEVHTDVLRTGRSASQVRATIVQGERRFVEATFTMGSLSQGPTPPWWTDRPMVDLAPLEECIPIPASRPGAAFEVPIMDRCDLRLDPACMGFAAGRPAGIGELKGWICLADHRPIDALALLFLADSLPPASFDLVQTGWVPTLSMTVHVRAFPMRGWLRIRQAVQVMDHDRFDEVCEIWDGTGRLVAQATQLAGIRLPPDAEPPAHP